MDARIEDFCCKRKTNRYIMLMLYFIVEVRINNAFSLMRQAKLSEGKETFYERAFSYKTIKSMKMPRAMTSKINVKPLLFMTKHDETSSVYICRQVPGLRCKICRPDEYDTHITMIQITQSSYFHELE
ncbi:hypothetical protein T05_9344 [Trichinella murrelli]|uniref:Uncharacterized protein n=1 Tax=Trichinella murrelli TaxID=144512 RepID=A0A0V0T8A2_9BILA|nr:hypothetical protein T05_9344 [Trichinella murrelli]